MKKIEIEKREVFLIIAVALLLILCAYSIYTAVDQRMIIHTQDQLIEQCLNKTDPTPLNINFTWRTT